MAKRKSNEHDGVEIDPMVEGGTAEEGAEVSSVSLLARIAELEAQVARQQVDIGPPPQEWPKVLYRRHAIDGKHPMGYEARRFADAEAVAAQGKGWQEADSVEGQALLAGE